VSRDRISKRKVARQYGTSIANVDEFARRGLIPFHRVESYVREDGTTGERFVYLQSLIDADKRRRGELVAERSVGAVS
jgi:hypothetical protein